MSPLRQRMIVALQLSGKSERTQQASVREVHLLSKFYKKSPLRISAADLQTYFLHRKHVDHLAPHSMRLCSSGIRFFYPNVLKRDWHTLSLMRAQTERRLPTVLRVADIRRLLKASTPLHHQVSFTTLYSLGLRLQEGLFLQPAAIDSKRRMGHVHRGQGAKDRYVPLPEDTLALLRTYWTTPRNTTWLFPATGRDQKHMAIATAPMSCNRVHGACRQAKQRAGITQTGVALPTLRHAYATPLLEAGVNLRLIQLYRGPTRLDTPMLSLHLTHTGHEDASERINAGMRGLPS